MHKSAHLALVPLLAALAGPAFAAPPMSNDPVPVGVVTVTKQAVPRIVTLPGRATAVQQAEIRPRVDGIITKILYTSGSKVNVGDPLFQLDDASYVATVASDQAAVDKAASAIPTDQANYDRAVKLQGQGYTEAQVATYKSTLEADQATLAAAKAALNYAQIQLGWTMVRSPIEGYVEVPAVTVGNLVTSAQSTALTTVTRLDPIYVDVLEPSANLLSIRNLIDTGVLKPSDKLEAQLTLEDGQSYKGTGQVVAPSSTVSTTTGTVSIRFSFANAERKLLPGMFLRAQVTLGMADAFLVPQLAGTVSVDGFLSVYVVKDGKAALTKLTEIGTHDKQWIVADGLQDGDQIVVDGLKYMAAGRPVKPVPASVSPDGAVARSAAGDAPKPSN